MRQPACITLHAHTWPVFIPETKVLVSRMDKSPCSSRNSLKSWRSKQERPDKRGRRRGETGSEERDEETRRQGDEETRRRGDEETGREGEGEKKREGARERRVTTFDL